MLMSLQEVLETCPNWGMFCEEMGFSEWAVNEGGGDVVVELTTQQAHKFGIVTLPEWRVEK